MRYLLVSLFLFLATHSVHAGEPVRGLLSLPGVFGEYPCEEFSPETIALYASPGSSDPTGEIRVERYWEFPPEGGCKGLSVVSELTDGGTPQELPTMEYGYEIPGAIVVDHAVVDHDEQWFKLDTGEASAWLRAPENSQYFTLEKLLVNRRTYVAPEAGAFLVDAPATTQPETERMHLEQYSDVRVTDVRWVRDQLWLQVNVLNESGCESRDEPIIIARGWLPAHSESGELSVWFYSRGC
jgi:hypothetical protein